MQGVDGSLVKDIDEVVKGGEGGFSIPFDDIAVGDEDQVLLGEAFPGIEALFLLQHIRRFVCVVHLQDAFQLGHEKLRLLLAVSR